MKLYENLQCVVLWAKGGHSHLLEDDSQNIKIYQRHEHVTNNFIMI